MTRRRQDPDANRLVAELADVVRAEINRRRLSTRVASWEMQVGQSTLAALLRGLGVGLDTFAALARWAGYDVALTPRPDGSATAIASTVGEPEPDAAIAAIMDGLADAGRHEANGAEVACYVLEGLEAAGYQVAPVPR